MVTSVQRSVTITPIGAPLLGWSVPSTRLTNDYINVLVVGLHALTSHDNILTDMHIFQNILRHYLKITIFLSIQDTKHTYNFD